MEKEFLKKEVQRGNCKKRKLPEVDALTASMDLPGFQFLRTQKGSNDRKRIIPWFLTHSQCVQTMERQYRFQH